MIEFMAADHRGILTMLIGGAMLLMSCASFAPAAPTSQPNSPSPDPKPPAR